MLVLGIETSCDETGAALVQNGKLVAESLASSMTEHIRFGGVIPEIASRSHLESIPAVISELIEKTGDKEILQKVDAIGVTAGPGLVGCLSVGLNYAKGLAVGLNKPLYAVNHVCAHILAAGLEKELPKKFLALIVSGGHTSLVLVDGLEFKEIGRTIDDAAGECFDKVGRMLGLNYPAGKEIDDLAKKGDFSRYEFPLPLTAAKFDDVHFYDFSFSGLKTAARRILESRGRDSDFKIEDFCASLAQTVAKLLTLKTLRAVKKYEVETVVIGGGFSANSQLRKVLQKELKKESVELIVPSLKYCTDNGSMIAVLTEKLAEKKPASDLLVDVSSSLAIKEVQL